MPVFKATDLWSTLILLFLKKQKIAGTFSFTLYLNNTS